MKRVIGFAGGGFVLFVAALAVFFVWGSSGHVPEPLERQIKTYDASPAAPRDTLTVMTYNVLYATPDAATRPPRPTHCSGAPPA